MTRICAIAMLALFASAATASDPYEQLRQANRAHLECAVDAAMTLLDSDGTPESLARQAVGLCRDKAAALGWYGAYATQDAVRRLAEVIRGERKIPLIFRGKLRPVAEIVPLSRPGRMMCASVGCGMRPTLDPKTKVWRPYPHQR